MECNTTKRYNLIHACPIQNIEDHVTNTEKDESSQIYLICEMQAIQKGTFLAPKRESFGFLIVGLLYNSNFSLSWFNIRKTVENLIDLVSTRFF